MAGAGTSFAFEGAAALPPATQHTLVGREFFPSLISAAFRNGLHAALDFAIVASLVAAGASWLRGGKFVYREEDGFGDEASDDEAPDDAVGGDPVDDTAVPVGNADGPVSPGTGRDLGRRDASSARG